MISQVVEEALDPNLFKDLDAKVMEMHAMAQAQQRLNDMKALTKEDFVKCKKNSVFLCRNIF